ncbi:MAG: hypothetical protein KDA91_16380 [Planctomycetaceae bacterium]|nr:hypothetical protein [Planctomycetaceae bacterium]
MTTRKLVRNLLLTASLTSAYAAPITNSADGDETTGWRARQRPLRPVPTQTGGNMARQPHGPQVSNAPATQPVISANATAQGGFPRGIQPVQYQATNSQPSGASNPAVMSELQRLFHESGRPMPQMNGFAPQTQQMTHNNPQNNLQNNQNTRVVTQTPPGMVQNSGVNGQNAQVPSQQPFAGTATAPVAGTGQGMAPQQRPATPPPKKNFFQKFVGKLRGESSPQTPAAKPVTPTSPASHLSTYSAPPPGSPQQRSVQPGSPARPSGSPMIGQANQASKAHSGQMAQTPNLNGARTNSPSTNPPSYNPNPVTAQRPGIPHGQQNGMPVAGNRTTTLQPPNRFPQYVQPGTAPSFVQGYTAAPTPMPSATTSTASAAASMGQHPPVDRTPITPAPVAPAPSDFVDPFENSVVENGILEGDPEVLDLDSLIEIPGQTRELPTQETDSDIAATAGNFGSEQTISPAQDAPDVAAPDAPAGNQQSGSETGMTATADMPISNPFTGVQLPMSDDEFFVQDESPSSDGGLLVGEPVPPMEEFSEELPGIELPPVEEASAPEDSVKSSTSSVQATPVTNTREESAFSQTTPEEQRPRTISNAGAVAASVTADQARREHQRNQIRDRAGRAGFKGFCPVELRDHRELVDAREEFTGTFGLQEYQFSSSRAKAAFEANPSRYAPAAGGRDIVLLVNTGEETEGMLDYSLWFRDRLYFFSSRETMNLFSENPARFANQY